LGQEQCLNRGEFVIVGSSDPEGSRPLLGALVLGYYDLDGRLIYAGRAGIGLPIKTLIMLRKRLRPWATKMMPLAKAPPRRRLGSKDRHWGVPL
jgi:bifunctional non-homologous end joining protein LigD